MLPAPRNWAIWPAIVKADCPTTMTIAPTERAFILFDGEPYEVTVVAVNGDETDYQTHDSLITLPCTPENGVITFPFCPAGEQEYTFILKKDGKPIADLHAYSLFEDLYARTPMKGDFHAHSHRSDGKRDPAALSGHFREQGYDCFALTDHNRYYPGGEIEEVYRGVRLGLVHLTGEEVHTPGSDVHIVHVGGRDSVAARYVLDTPTYEQEAAAYLDRVPENVPQQYAARYARAMWATDKIHEAGGLAIFAHPYWRPGNKVYNVNDDFTRIFLKSGMFDAFELVGGMTTPGINRAVALWQELTAEGYRIPVVGSSDVHGLTGSEDFPHHFTVLFAETPDSNGILDAIRKGYSVGVEGTGTEYAREHRAYGSLRLVTFAQFLLQHYFPLMQRICQGEGVAMRAFAMGEAPAELIELQAAYSADFAARFFGKKPPVLPDAAMLEFEKKWRAVHLEKGPITKGSRIISDKISRQI